MPVSQVESFAGQPAPVPVEARPLWRAGRASPRTSRRLCEAAALASAAAFAVPVGELHATTRRSSYVAFARQSAMYLSHTTFGVDLRAVAKRSAAIAPQRPMPAG